MLLCVFMRKRKIFYRQVLQNANHTFVWLTEFLVEPFTLLVFSEYSHYNVAKIVDTA